MWDKYNFYKVNVPEVQVEDMGFSKRVLNLLVSNGLMNSKDISESYTVGKIYEIKGLGKKAAQEISLWVQKNKNYKNQKNYKEQKEIVL